MVKRGDSGVVRGLGPYLLLSAALIAAYLYLAPVRTVTQSAAVIGIPIHFLASLPSTALNAMQGHLTTTDQLRFEFEAIRQRNLILRTRLHRFEFLENENARLRALLSATPSEAEQVTLAALLAVNPDPGTLTVLIDKGSADGVFQGQPVVDSGGLIGQVTKPGLFRSKVSLITQEDQAVPAQVARSGLRTVTYGGGSNRPLRVLYLDRNADIRAGDLLVTSGLGGRYPPGYPVALITGVERNLAEAFMTIAAEPASHLGRDREVLLLWLSEEGTSLHEEEVETEADDD
jgi:rod shape-determining protein MreC